MLLVQILKQSFLPSFISLIGLMFSASILSKLELSDIGIGIPFKVLQQLTVLVPVISNLNGNLELNLSCRLSTCANNGKLNRSVSRIQLYHSNLIYMLFQSILLGLFSSSFAILVSGLVGILSTLREFMILTVASIVTISLGTLLLGTFMNGLIIQCVLYDLDPDNIAAPIACAFGDATTLILFILVANVCLLDSTGWVCFIVLLGCLIALAYLYTQLPYTTNDSIHPYSIDSYLPYIISISITTFCGLALEEYLDTYKGLASLAPVINGLSGGNTAIYASRITTSFSMNRQEDSSHIISAVWILTIFNVFLLLLLSTVFHITSITTRLLFGSLITSNICLFLLISFVKPFCTLLNKHDIDLEAVILPILTALGDLGTIIYILVFYCLRFV